MLTFTDIPLKHFEKCIEMYRHVQLLSSIGNEIQQKTLIFPVIVACVLNSAYCLAMMVVTPFTSENCIVHCVLVGVYLDTTFYLLFCLGGMVAVRKMSKYFLRKLNAQFYLSPSRIKERKAIKSLKRSVKLIKIKFGTNNFVEELTPLRFLNLAARISIQILLSERRKLAS